VDVRDSGSGRVIAVVLVFFLLIGGAVAGLRLYRHFTPAIVGGAQSPAKPLTADHVYNIPIRYTVADGVGRRIDAIRIPTIKGLDLTVTGIDCDAPLMEHPLSEGPNLSNSLYAPELSPRAYFAKITRKLYGYKIGTQAAPAVCAALTVHSKTPGTYHIGALALDWRAGLLVGRVHDHTDVTLNFVVPKS
jgi:hypothetical protein